MFSPTVIDHFDSPRNVGEIADADATWEEENPICGDRLRVWLRVDGERVAEMRWRAEGCAPAIAAASITSELVTGMPLSEARMLDKSQVDAALGGLPARKAHAAALAASAVRHALLGMPTTDSRGAIRD